MERPTHEILLAAIRDALAERPGRRKQFLDRWRRTAGWHGSYAQATNRLAEWLDAENVHRFPLEALPDLVRAVGNAQFLDALLALEAKVQRAHRVRKVEPREREGQGRRGAA